MKISLSFSIIQFLFFLLLFHSKATSPFLTDEMFVCVKERERERQKERERQRERGGGEERWNAGQSFDTSGAGTCRVNPGVHASYMPISR